MSAWLPKLPRLPRPSRGMVIFGSVVSTIGGTLYADKKRCEATRERICAQAKVLADQPMQPSERPPKIAIYITRPPGHDNLYRPRHWFRKYIKPVLDSAALDYDLIEGVHPGVIEEHAKRTLLAKNRRVLAAQQPDSAEHYKSVLTASPEEDLSELLQRDNYDGYVALGRKPFEELCSAYNDAAHTWLSARASLRAESATSAPVQSSSWWSSLWASSPSQNKSSAAIPDVVLPPVGYLPVVALSGWATVPRRLFYWFNDNAYVEAMGEAALQLVQQTVRPAAPHDLQLGFDPSQAESGDEPVSVVDAEMREFWAKKSPATAHQPGSRSIGGVSANDLLAAAPALTSSTSVIAAAPSEDSTASPQPPVEADIEKREPEPKKPEKTDSEKQDERRKKAYTLWQRYQHPRPLERVVADDVLSRLQVFDVEQPDV
ncbi:mitochondrial import inner membrane translocase subunit tim54 [Sorochytrium milnesiophthora]